MALTAAGHGDVRPGTTYPLGGHPNNHALTWQRGRVIDALQVVYISQGEGEFETKLTGRRRIVAGTVFFLLPGIWHRYRPLRDIGWIEDWVELRSSTAARLVAERVIDPRSPIENVGDQEPLRDLFRQCVELIDEKPVGFEAIADAIGLQIVALAKAVAERRSGGEQRRVASAISRAQTLIARQMDKPMRTHALARELRVSESYFRRAFKAQTGLTPKRYHSDLRLRYAKELLLSTELSIKEIAGLLGFHSPFHFSAHFKLQLGVSPSQWRQKISLAGGATRDGAARM